MKYLILIPLSTLLLEASLLDFKYLEEAKEAYNDKNYTKAQELYGRVDRNEAKFNQADSLYRQKKYQEAIELYKRIDEPKLEAKKLHNIGNSYAQMKKIDEAIKSYEEALKLGDDADTKFNLDLLKKKKEEEKKKQKDKKKDNQDKKKDKNDKNKENQKDSKEQKDNKENKDSDQKKSQEQKNKEEEQKKKDKEAQKKEQEEQKKKEKQKDKEKQAKMGDKNQTQPPISNMEERKWQKMLNQRGVNTLMIPLNKGKKENETNLW